MASFIQVRIVFRRSLSSSWSEVSTLLAGCGQRVPGDTLRGILDNQQMIDTTIYFCRRKRCLKRPHPFVELFSFIFIRAMLLIHVQCGVSRGVVVIESSGPDLRCLFSR
jgi:hypothetical protein